MIVVLNVGGVIFQAWRSTLEESSSFFSGLVSESSEASFFFIDRDPTHFRHILNWLRGSLTYPPDALSFRELMMEAEFYSLQPMVSSLQKISQCRQLSNPNTLENILQTLQRNSSEI